MSRPGVDPIADFRSSTLTDWGSSNGYCGVCHHPGFSAVDLSNGRPPLTAHIATIAENFDSVASAADYTGVFAPLVDAYIAVTDVVNRTSAIADGELEALERDADSLVAATRETINAELTDNTSRINAIFADASTSAAGDVAAVHAKVAAARDRVALLRAIRDLVHDDVIGHTASTHMTTPKARLIEV